MPHVSRILASPWGLILPLTGLALLLLATQLERMPSQLAATHAQRLVDCPESEVAELVDAIVRLGDSGLPALVSGLRSERESVFYACRNALERNLEHWAKQTESVQSEHYRRLTESLLAEVDGFKQTALIATAEFVDRILRETARHQSSDPKNSAAVAVNCERLLDWMQTTRKRMQEPNDAAPTGDSIVRLHRSAVDPMLMAAEEPIHSDLPFVDEFAQPRAELLHAYHRSPTYRQQAETPYRRPGFEALPPGIAPMEDLEPQREMIASMGPAHRPPSKNVFAAVEPLGKVANRPVPEFNTGNIAENYIADGPRSRPMERDDFLTDDLNRVALERVPSLSTTKLMRLLQHADERVVSAARKTLIGRDGFQESHLKLAFQIYHPLPTVRAELIGLLPSVSGIQQSVWLTELMNDPNADVRFLAASAIATTSDPSMQRLLLDKGKRDADPRIVELAEQILEQRRSIRR